MRNTREVSDFAFSATDPCSLPSPPAHPSGCCIPPTPELPNGPPLRPPRNGCAVEPEAKFRIWFEIEAHATEKLGELGVVPKARPRPCGTGGRPIPRSTSRRSTPIEAVTKHDVIAFLTWVAGPGRQAGALHAPGHDQSDVLDTTLNVQLRAASDMLLDDLDALLAALKRRAEEHKIHADHRPQPRHPCRADHLRAQAGPGLCRIRALPRRGWSPRAPISRPARSRRGRDLRQYRSGGGRACRRENGPRRSSRSRPR